MMEAVKGFYESYVDWLDNGAPEGYPYSRHEGLCIAIGVYLFGEGYNQIERDLARREMKAQFLMAKLDTDYPFNRDCSEYGIESRMGTCHLNENRIMWVNKEWKHYAKHY